MAESVDFILGFDPGGRSRFGWSVCKADGDKLHPPSKAGLANDAQDAIDRIKEAIKELSDDLPSIPRVLAAGIDAPMFWSTTGNRIVDDILRTALKLTGIPRGKISGTVQQVNSLQGACLVQGVLLGKYLHETWNLKITEAHPTALRFLLEGSGWLEKVEPLIANLNDHKRDATIAAFAAWSMHKELPGWRDLYQDEPSPVRPFDTPVSYWMPIRCNPQM